MLVQFPLEQEDEVEGTQVPYGGYYALDENAGDSSCIIHHCTLSQRHKITGFSVKKTTPFYPACVNM